MAEFKTTGFVLQRQNFGEADRLLKVFTRDFGLITVLAKGVRKPAARFGSAVEIFNELNLRLQRRTSEIFLLTEAGLPKFNQVQVLPNLRMLFLAAELILALAPPEKKLPKVYAYFRSFWKNLGRVLESQCLHLIWVAFRVKILVTLGFLALAQLPVGEQQKLGRILLAQDFGEMRELAYAKGVLVNLDNFLQQVLQRILGRDLRGAKVTGDWI